MHAVEKIGLHDHDRPNLPRLSASLRTQISKVHMPFPDLHDGIRSGDLVLELLERLKYLHGVFGHER